MAENAASIRVQKFIMGSTRSISNAIRYVKWATQTKGLNLFFAALCIIDLLGVFPIATLPAAIISCGIIFYSIPVAR